MENKSLLQTIALWVGVALVAVLIVIGAVSFYKKLGLQPNTQTPQPPTVEEKKIKKTEGTMTFDIVYPVVDQSTAMSTAVEQYVNQQIEEFKKNVNDNEQMLKDNNITDAPHEYSLTIKYEKNRMDASIASVALQGYSFTGGAHGQHFAQTFNYDIKKNSALLLSDVLKEDPAYLKKLSAYCVKELTKKITDQMKDDQGKVTGKVDTKWINEGAGPKAENYELFTIGTDSLTVYFLPYAVAPYAFGDYTIAVPLSVFSISSADSNQSSTKNQTQSNSNGTKQTTRIANPASTFCKEKGGVLTIQTQSAGGQYGICSFPEDKQCEEWAMFRGQCPIGGIRIAGYKTPASRYCVLTGNSYGATTNAGLSNEKGICSFKNGTACEAEQFFSGVCSAITALDVTRSNLASPFCTSHGGTVVFKRKGSGATYGVCALPQERECELWAFYRGNCPSIGVSVKDAPSEAATYCLTNAGTYSSAGLNGGTCRLYNGTYCDANAYFAGTCPK